MAAERHLPCGKTEEDHTTGCEETLEESHELFLVMNMLDHVTQDDQVIRLRGDIIDILCNQRQAIQMRMIRHEHACIFDLSFVQVYTRAGIAAVQERL